jgi:hypothetical protein
MSPRSLALLLLAAVPAAAQFLPPDPRAAELRNLPTGFTVAPDPETSPAAAILTRSFNNFPDVGATGTANGIPELLCGTTASPDDVSAEVRDVPLTPIVPGYEFWFTFTLTATTSVVLETSNTDSKFVVDPILAVYLDRVASGEAMSDDFGDEGLDSSGQYRFILKGKADGGGCGNHARIYGVTLDPGHVPRDPLRKVEPRLVQGARLAHLPRVIAMVERKICAGAPVCRADSAERFNLPMCA